jgi:hypothetical protein
MRVASSPAAAIDFIRQAMPSGPNDAGEAEYDYERKLVTEFQCIYRTTFQLRALMSIVARTRTLCPSYYTHPLRNRCTSFYDCQD